MAAASSSSSSLAAGAALNAAESSNATTTTNNDDDINSGGGSGQVEALPNQQQQQQQQQQQRSSGGDIIVHLSRDWMALFLIYYQCSVNDLVPLLLDVCMNDYIGMVAKELVFSMKSPILYRRPDKKRAIKDVLARAAVDIPCVIELISPEWPVRDKPKVPDEIMEELDNTHCLQSTMGGVVLQYILHGKGVTPHHHQEATGPPASSSPSPSPTAKVHANKACSIDEGTVSVDEASGERNGEDDDGCSSPNKPPPSFSCLSDEGSTTLPPTPSLSPSLASSSSMDDSPPPSAESPPPSVESPPPFVESPPTPSLSPSLASSSSMDESPPPPPPPSTPPLAQLPPPSLASSMKDSRPTPRTFSVNPLGGMFSPPLDKPRVVEVIRDVLCSKRVLNYRGKASKVMVEVKSGCVSAETMEWVIRGLRSLRGKKELKQRHGGLVFVGPQWGAPLYKTGNGVGRLLRGVAKKHGAGKKFVVCVSSGSSGDNATSDTKMITGIISNAPNASPSASNSTGHVEPVMDGDAPSLQDWSNVRGNLDDGSRLWAWVY